MILSDARSANAKALPRQEKCGIIDEMAAEIRPEMERNCKRWSDPKSVDEWEASIEELKKTIANRRPYAIKEIKNLFGLSNERMTELFPNDWE